MTRVAKKIGRMTWPAADATSSVLSTVVGFASRRRRIASVTTIAPSTMTPKSIAPSENRFAGIFVACIKMNTVTSDSGIVTATTRALRGLPRNRINTMQTRPTPSITVCETLLTVACTRSSRSMYGTMCTSIGPSRLASSATFA